MFCQRCGSKIPQGQTVCQACQAVQPLPVKIKSHMTDAIIVTICCCLPFGIVGIVYASKVSSLLAAGNIVAAQDAAKKAQMWSWIGFGCGLVANAIYFGLQLLGACLE